MAVEPRLTNRSQRTRAELSRATHDEVGRTGTLDVSAIAEGAGVSTATFYAHFATHDDALAAALDIALDRILTAGEQQFHIEALLDLGLPQVVRRLIAATHAAFQTESLVFRAALARLPQHRGIRDVYRHHEARSLEHFTHQIDLGQKAGLLRDGPAKLRATSLLVIIQGINNPLLTKKRMNPSIAADLNRSITAMIGPA